MNIKKSVLAVDLILSAMSSGTALALDLYVDKDTQQLYAAPGPNRVSLGSFEKKEDLEQMKQKLKAEIEQELKQKQTAEAAAKLAASIKTAHAEAEFEPVKKVALPKGNVAAGVSYGKSGFTLSTEDNKFSLAIQNRIQARFAEPFDSDPRTLNDLNRDENSFMIRRARTKLSGHAYAPWLKYYMQYDWSQPVLRDLSLTVDK